MSRQPKGRALTIRTSRDLKIFARRHAASCRIRPRLPLYSEKKTPAAATVRAPRSKYGAASACKLAVPTMEVPLDQRIGKADPRFPS